MKIAREVSIYRENGIKGGISEAEKRASKVATSFITRVSESEGIMVHDAEDLTDYVQVNSNAIAMYRDNVEKMQLTDESLRMGDTLNNAVVDADGMTVYKEGADVAHFGSTARLGTETGGRTEVSSNGMDVYAEGVTSPLLKASASGFEVGGSWTGIKMTGGTDDNNHAYGEIGLNDLSLFSSANLKFGRNSQGDPAVYLSSGDLSAGADLSLDSGYAASLMWFTGLLSPTYAVRVGSSGITLDATDKEVRIYLSSDTASGIDYDLKTAIANAGWTSEVTSSY